MNVVKLNQGKVKTLLLFRVKQLFRNNYRKYNIEKIPQCKYQQKKCDLRDIWRGGCGQKPGHILGL